MRTTPPETRRLWGELAPLPGEVSPWLPFAAAGGAASAVEDNEGGVDAAEACEKASDTGGAGSTLRRGEMATEAPPPPRSRRLDGSASSVEGEVGDKAALDDGEMASRAGVASPLALPPAPTLEGEEKASSGAGEKVGGRIEGT